MKWVVSMTFEVECDDSREAVWTALHQSDKLIPEQIMCQEKFEPGKSGIFPVAGPMDEFPAKMMGLLERLLKAQERQVDDVEHGEGWRPPKEDE